MRIRTFFGLLLVAHLAAVEDPPAVPLAFQGDWEAVVEEVRGDYTAWYRPDDVTPVAISRIGLLRTLDGGGGGIHFLLVTDPHDRQRVTARRPLPGLPVEEVVIVDDGDGCLVVTVTLPEHGGMRLRLGRPLPRANG